MKCRGPAIVLVSALVSYAQSPAQPANGAAPTAAAAPADAESQARKQAAAQDAAQNARIAAIEQQIAEAAKTAGENDPGIVKLRDQLRRTRLELIQSRIARLRNDLKKMEMDFGADDPDVKRISAQLAQMEAAATKLQPTPTAK